jgi:phosphoribosyl 1,2-cyclic phosphate phosphodiesterase
MNRFLFLGTGSSLGIPVIGCSCEVCRSNDPKNRRFRPSGLVTIGKKNLLIDAGPDLRMQALQHQIRHVDGVLFTHIHHDHTAGIDELRVFHFKAKKSLPCLVSKETAQNLMFRYDYMFTPQKGEIEYPRLALKTLEGTHGQVDFEGCQIGYFTYEQLGMKVNGFRFGNLAYITDIKEYSESIFDDLIGVDILILSALRFTSSHMHLTIDDAIAFAERTHAKQTWLTHISHDLDHEKTNSYLPPHIQLAYDGLSLEFTL